MVDAVYPIVGNEFWLPFYLTGIGVCEPEYRVERSNGLVSYQILFTRSGKGVLKVGGNTYIQTAGSVFYLSPFVPHEYYPQENDWTTCWVVFRGGELGSLMRSMGFQPYLCADGDISALNEIFNKLFDAAKDPIGGGEKCSRLVYDLILETRSILIDDHRSAGYAGSLLQSAVEYIEGHYTEDIPLEKLASLSEVSLQHFCRVCRNRMNMRPMEYIARRRISHAKLLLCNTTEPVSRVGEECGYTDPTYFGTVFKRYVGVTPGEYRRHRGSEQQ